MTNDNFTMKMSLENIDGEYNTLLEYSDSDNHSASISVVGESLTDVLETIYQEMVDELIKMSEKKKDPADMTDEEYIQYLEEEIIRLKQEKENSEKNFNKTKYYNEYYPGWHYNIKATSTKPASSDDLIKLINQYAENLS